jgi:uncharacterized membrane protein
MSEVGGEPLPQTWVILANIDYSITNVLPLPQTWVILANITHV